MMLSRKATLQHVAWSSGHLSTLQRPSDTMQALRWRKGIWYSGKCRWPRYNSLQYQFSEGEERRWQGRKMASAYPAFGRQSLLAILLPKMLLDVMRSNVLVHLSCIANCIDCDQHLPTEEAEVSARLIRTWRFLNSLSVLKRESQNAGADLRARTVLAC